MRSQDNLDYLEDVDITGRSDLVKKAESLGIDPNEFIHQVVRTFPSLIIINDMGYHNSVV